MSYNQLKKLVDFPYSPEELAQRLTDLGLEVREIKSFGKTEGILVGKIIKVKKHPNADRLKIVDVDIGRGKLSVVCGAPNVKEGLLVPVALEGAELQGNFKVKRVKIRGVESPGMICSEKELGLGEDHSGIMVLPSHLVPGAVLSEALEFEDIVLDLEITSNRGDCLSSLGVAREIAALTGSKVHIPLAEISKDRIVQEKNLPEVKIKDLGLCPYYAARIIKNVKIAPSPLWLRQKILIFGGNPINNAVDVTNYVMWELGQPLHPFDLETISGRKVIVRRAKEGESIVTLDDKCRNLTSEMLVIADEHNPIALAGIMGGKDTQVESATCNILLEAAYFNPLSVGKTSRKLGLITEASSRFEKGVDPEMVKKALDRAAFLIQEVAGGKIVEPLLEAGRVPTRTKKIYFRPLRVNKITGSRINPSSIEQILQNLGFMVKKTKEKHKWEVRVPAFRPDVEREIDLVEEVCRLYGYNKIKITLPSLGIQTEGESKEERLQAKLRLLLRGWGFYEVITNSLVGERLFELALLCREESVKIRNPLSRELEYLRIKLFPQLLNVASFNYNQEVRQFRLMEMGKIFTREEKLNERTSLAGVIVEEGFDFWNLKGIVEAILQETGINDVEFLPANLPYLSEEMSAFVKKREWEIGWLGKGHPNICEAFELPAEIYMFELNVNLIAALSQEGKKYHPLPRFPSVKRDLSIVVRENIPASQVKECVLTKGKWIENIEFFDMYQGGNIPAGHKSLSFSVTFRHPGKTLTDEEVNSIQKKILRALEKNLGATLRSK